MKTVLGTLSLADGTAIPRALKTDAEGRFDWEGVTPGVMRIGFELGGVAFSDALGKAIEARPGRRPRQRCPQGRPRQGQGQLEGDLPFEYHFDGSQGHWYGIEGIDWHLRTGRRAQ
jgi:hypothetical protein